MAQPKDNIQPGETEPVEGSEANPGTETGIKSKLPKINLSNNAKRALMVGGVFAGGAAVGAIVVGILSRGAKTVAKLV
jgi:hypothetical protein